MKPTILLVVAFAIFSPALSVAQTAGSGTNPNAPAPSVDGNAAPVPSTSSGVGAATSPNVANPNAADANAQNANGATFQGEIGSDQVIGEVVTALGAAQKKNWAMLVSSIIMLLVFAFDMFWVKNLPDDKRNNILPWLAVVVAAFIQFAATLASTGNWGQAVNMAFVTGTSASGLWSLIGKQVVGRLAPSSAAANPARQTTAVPKS